MNDKNYNISTFVRTLIKFIIKNGETSLNVSYEKFSERVTKRHSITNCWVYINDIKIRFISDLHNHEDKIPFEFRLDCAESEFSEIDDLPCLLEAIRFYDDLSESFIDNISIDEIDECISLCPCGGCNNLACVLKHCQVCINDTCVEDTGCKQSERIDRLYHYTDTISFVIERGHCIDVYHQIR